MLHSGGLAINVRRSLLIPSATAVATALTTLAVIGPPAEAGQAPGEPALRLVLASKSVTLKHRRGKPVTLNLGTHIAAGASPFEIHVQRKSYKDPVTATQIVTKDGKAERKPLPPGMVTKFSGLSKFLRIRLYDSRGKKVADVNQNFCPNGNEAARSHPDAPDTSPYPDGYTGCPTLAFTLGSVWGIQRGWAAGTYTGGKKVKLANGTYTAKISVAKAYRDFFGIVQADQKMNVKVRTGTGDHVRSLRDRALRPNSRRPGADKVPDGPKPDLRSLPAFGIRVTNKRRTKKSYVEFSANVWNAGPSRLVVDGFRRSDQDLMDAYQYFYDDEGKQVGHAKTGTMEWDPRDGHLHWHFKDFAEYRLLKKNQSSAVRSQKEAFCLANTDAIDYTVKNANWKPDATDLETACGERSSLAVREALEVGSGDTYDQTRPGQSFSITNLKNGTYYIQVVANPKNRLFETDKNNNVSLRKIILGGKKGKRTVKVPPHHGIKG